VSRFANALAPRRAEGDRVALPADDPGSDIAMLAVRIGPHSVVFGGFSADSLRDRINDAGAKVLVTADGGYRRGRVVALKEAADHALAETPSIEHVVVVRRGAGLHVPTRLHEGRDHWYDDLMEEVTARCGADGRG
jgi:acetyl-CoA synthetase